MLMDLEEQKVDFKETWAILYEALVSWDKVGVVAGVEEAFALGYVFQSSWVPVWTDIDHMANQLEWLGILLIMCWLVARWTQQSNLL